MVELTERETDECLGCGQAPTDPPQEGWVRVAEGVHCPDCWARLGQESLF